MTTGHPPIGRRALAGAAALALGLVGFGSAAFAADPLAPGNIDPNRTGTLNIHKLESGSMTDGPGTPNDNVDKTGTGVPGVVFTAYRVTNLDLATQADWNGLDKVSALSCGADHKSPSMQLPNGTAAIFDVAQGKASEPTGSDGNTSISDLKVAAYLVCETQAPAKVKKRAEPFFVTIPFPNNTANNATTADQNWLYTIDVYPKNTVVETPTKKIDVNSFGLATEGQITYTVSAKVPSIAADEQFKYFIIGDRMSAGQEADIASVKEVSLAGSKLDSSDYAVTEKDGKLYVSLKNLAALKAKPNTQVVVTFKTKATRIGELTNEADLSLDTEKTPTPPTPPVTPPDTPPDTPPFPPTPTNKVFSSWGDAIIAKRDKENQQKLSGAKFEVYAAEAPYAASCEGAKLTGDAISVNGKTEFTVGAEGTLTIAGLFVDKGTAAVAEDGSFEAVKWENGNTHRCYVLKETAAPAGYVLPTGDAALTPLKVTPNATASSTVDVTIDNTKQNVPQLPLTGANGQLLLLIGGSALILLAFGGALVLRRHGKQG